MSCGANCISMDDTMQSSAGLGPGSLTSESARILELVFQDPFYAGYSAESTITGAKVGITEYYPALPPARSSSRSERWARPSCSSAPIHSAQRFEANKSGSWVLSRTFYCWRCISLILQRYCPRQGAVTGYSGHCAPAPVRGAPSSSSAFC